VGAGKSKRGPLGTFRGAWDEGRSVNNSNLSGLSCSLTSCCDLSGGSPDDGRFPVRPSSQIPNAVWRQPASRAGTTRYLSRRSGEQLTSLRRSQSGGPGKHTSRSMTRTMQHRNGQPRRGLLAETGGCGWRLFDSPRQPGTCACTQREWRVGPTGVGSAARVESTAGKVGKVSRVASALPHSEGAAYKRQGREVAACLRDWRMGS
jgi:hypothetical protein